MSINESIVELAAIEWFEALGYTFVPGETISPDSAHPERPSYGTVILEGRVKAALQRLNPQLPDITLTEAYNKLVRAQSQDTVTNNREFHRHLIEGIPVTYRDDAGQTRGAQAQIVDWENIEDADLLVVNQFTVIEKKHNRRPDLVVFLNGLPISVIELKNAVNEDTTIDEAYNQLQTYKKDIPSLFHFNELLIISDGLDARVGSLTADRERFMPWRTIAGEDLAPKSLPRLQVVIEGLFHRERLLDFLRYFIVFEDEAAQVNGVQVIRTVKKLAGYHQFHAVRTAVQSVVNASQNDGRGGVVWHTQGSGKSLTMVFFAGKVIQHPALQNPTLVVLTDRNDLDDQLYGTFARCQDNIRQSPQKAENRAQLRSLLSVASGGVVFTTIQKFSPENKGDEYPLLTDRRNIIVMADEAHRSQYGFEGRVSTTDTEAVIEYGYAKHMRDGIPNATFLGFTGTPVDANDRSTRAVFGDYISIYDIERAVDDGATVPIYYESRLAKLHLEDTVVDQVDEEVETITGDIDDQQALKAKRKWAQLEAMAGTPERLRLVALDLVNHYEERCQTLTGKAMIVCMSRRIAVDLYNEIIKLRPEWDSEDDEQGMLKVIMTGSAADPEAFRPHVRNKQRKERLANRFRDAKDPLKLVIVRDMWLTGFDVPSLHTMYIDKPMRGYGLMQAIARVNRVFKDKPGGLIVDYIGIATQLREAMIEYTQSGGKGNTSDDLSEAVEALKKYLEICQDYFFGFDYSKFVDGKPSERLTVLPAAQEFLLEKDRLATEEEARHNPELKKFRSPRKRFIDAVVGLSRAFALCGTDEYARSVVVEVAFFQAIKVALQKQLDAEREDQGKKTTTEVDHAIQQLVSKAIIADEVIDVFKAAGLKKPNIGVLSDEFLDEIKGMPYKNLAIETLRKLLEGEIRSRSRTNVVQSRQFSEMLKNALSSYHNRGLQTAEILQELLDMAKEFRESVNRGEQLGLTEDELAFYDALGVNDSAVKIMGDGQLKEIAQDIVKQIRQNITIDWTVKEMVRARMRTLVRRTLRKYGYPPDKQDGAITAILEQAERVAAQWV
ncbi:type I restriction endonuclease subunit R [Deinococcus cellulosilyticus]|uniref:Type I restriction enzyme endonuclease subunit n=1 Tax=Deinococcus cellulosilyticus (strain DSM 18568 / NBRC 106333 / KACC 11606 / 5516J-15) TaxID=1223518 RepID=A0A511NAM9_DEIC1|nr:type I restriction endonuclease subunit R [Deinococcus cellulosilyticus]GEM49627.1 DEAD/DEAH box helicase [Deinococcus cellulosilyticus NBRC 106333 = KACC 11606]